MAEVEESGIGRAFKLFEYFDNVRRPVGVVEATEVLGFPRSSTAALFTTLVKLGYLTHDRATRSYIPTAKLSDLGRWSDSVLFGEDRTVIAQFAKQVGRATAETVVIGIRDDLDAQYIYVELPQRPVLYLVQAGARRPLCRSAVGWALLSTVGDDEIARIVARWNRLSPQPSTAMPLEAVRKEVERVRSSGYAFSRHSFVQGIGMIAVLLPQRPGVRRMAVGVGGPVDRLDARKHEIIGALHDAIASILPLNSDGVATNDSGLAAAARDC